MPGYSAHGRDLNVPIKIEVCPTVRESDGLAMSSRNRYLDADQRRQALALIRSLECAVGPGGTRRDRSGDDPCRDAAGPGGRRNYAGRLCCSGRWSDFRDVSQVTSDTVALVAAYVGTTRLIDNRRIG